MIVAFVSRFHHCTAVRFALVTPSGKNTWCAAQSLPLRLINACMRESLPKMFFAVPFCGEMLVFPMENSHGTMSFSGVVANLGV